MKQRRTRLIVFAAAAWAAVCAAGLSGQADVRPQAESPVRGLPVDPVYDEIASFLAGRPCRTAPYMEFQETDEYRAYAAALEEQWAAMESARLGPIRTWAEREIAESRAAAATLFYPFGGPDGLTPLVLYPGAAHYLLLGLEFVGRMPEFQASEAEKAARYILSVQDALEDFFKKSYFITKNMNAELADDKVDGVLPILCFFLKRSGYTISSVRRLEISEKGAAVESPYPGEQRKRRRPFGVRIAFFAEGTSVPRDMSYISCDLENKAFGEGTPLDLYLQGLPFETTFVKSASYLMHYREFSRIRELVLARSRYILQDDTGIPFRHFKPEKWDVRLYGTYAPPVADFKNLDQPDLQAAFEEPGRAKSLPFPIGYHWGTKKVALLSIVKK
ncbi:MAG: hypothetical protein JW843_05975 [Candidatus Aminicenantes bacterium]|nr:hypothetical protein [Candidatus Aminicenantes bacterium]